MKTISIQTCTPYEIIIGSHFLSSSGVYIKKVFSGKRAVIVTDDLVNQLYAQTVLKSLQNAGIQASIFVFPHGETHKSFTTLNQLYAFLAQEQITRSDLLVALGGGVVGDLAGFAAATWMRGIRYVQIPTSLLAQVDSSVGGKTAIDIPEGKNLVGAFHQPLLVLCDIETLKTLSPEFFADGMGEVIKYGMIRSKNLFDQLLLDDPFNCLENIIEQCIAIKRDVVQNDEFDTGERMVLNFGHTLGHGIEKYYNYTGISHGHAVAAGMALITAYSERHNITSHGVYEQLKTCLQKYNLPVAVSPSVSEMIHFCLNDKKRTGDKISLVLCKEIGECKIVSFTLTEFYRFFDILKTEME